jgi:hypothetical protein
MFGKDSSMLLGLIWDRRKAPGPNTYQTFESVLNLGPSVPSVGASGDSAASNFSSLYHPANENALMKPTFCLAPMDGRVSEEE